MIDNATLTEFFVDKYSEEEIKGILKQFIKSKLPEYMAARSDSKGKPEQTEVAETIENCKKQIEQLQQELEKEREETQYQKGLNRRLLEISRERANADRNIRPKKERTGYVMLYSRQLRFRCNGDTVYLWKTGIQTPFNIKISAEQVMYETLEQFTK